MEPQQQSYPDPQFAPQDSPERSVPPAKRPRRRPGKKLLLIPLIVLILLIGGAAAAYFLRFQNEEVASTTPPPPPTTAETETEAPPADRTFSSDELGLEMEIPGEWQEDAAAPYTTFKAADELGKFDMVLQIGKTTSIKPACETAAQDTAPLTYSKPLPEQRPTSSISYFGEEDTNKLCDVMITGVVSFKKGETFPVNPGLDKYKNLPEHRIVATFTDSTDPNAYPDMETVLSSDTYKDLVMTLEGLKVK